MSYLFYWLRGGDLTIYYGVSYGSLDTAPKISNQPSVRSCLSMTPRVVVLGVVCGVGWGWSGRGLGCGGGGGLGKAGDVRLGRGRDFGVRSMGVTSLHGWIKLKEVLKILHWLAWPRD